MIMPIAILVVIVLTVLFLNGMETFKGHIFFQEEKACFQPRKSEECIKIGSRLFRMSAAKYFIFVKGYTLRGGMDLERGSYNVEFRGFRTATSIFPISFSRLHPPSMMIPIDPDW